MYIYMDPRQVYMDNGQLDNVLYAGRRPATDMYVQQGCRYGTYTGRLDPRRVYMDTRYEDMDPGHVTIWTIDMPTRAIDI